jgi:hypothetical protein
MTTQTAPDISITTSGPTTADAQIMLQLAALQDDRFRRGMNVLWADEAKALTYEEFKAAYPSGTEAHNDAMSVLTWYETVGTLVKNGLVNRDLILDWLWVSGVWARCASIAAGQRAETVPQMWENFEALAKAQQAT